MQQHITKKAKHPFRAIVLTGLAFSLFLTLSTVNMAQSQDGTSTEKKEQKERFQGGGEDLSKAIAGIGKGAETFSVLVGLTTTIAVSLAFLAFFWNLFQYVRASGDDQKEEAKSKMGWSVLAIVVITSLWGIIAFVRGVLGIDSSAESNNIEIPITKFKKSADAT